MKRESLLAVLACTIAASATLALAAGPAKPTHGPAWKRHTIDDSSRGADGTRILDVNGDGLPDIATGWEEGGVVRVYLHPGHDKVRGKWQAVTVGKVPSIEDAVFADLDGDGRADVISAAEGGAKRISIHWAPKDRAAYTDAAKWTTTALPASLGQQWMFCVPVQLDGKHGLDFIAGSKGRGASIGWFQAPSNPRDAKAWKYHKLRDAGWIMSIIAADMNADGRADILFSDRKGTNRGVHWLANPGPGDVQAKPWTVHTVGATDRECLFLDHADLDGDGRRDIVVTAKPKDLIFFRAKDTRSETWESSIIALPAGAGRSKAVAVGDIDLDSRADLVFSCESAKPPLSGVMWLSPTGPATAGKWTAHDVSGPAGVKFDLVVLKDLDNDGDLDILTCEERQNLGVFWYENRTGVTFQGYRFTYPDWWDDVEVRIPDTVENDAAFENYIVKQYGSDVGNESNWASVLKSYVRYWQEQKDCKEFPVYIGHCYAAGGKHRDALEVFASLHDLAHTQEGHQDWYHCYLAYEAAKECMKLNDKPNARKWALKASKFTGHKDKAIDYYARNAPELLKADR